MTKRVYEFVFIFCFGAFGYSIIEMVWRGYTHWTMTLTGGVVFIALYILNTRILTDASLIKRCIAGSLTITFIEFIVGYIVNIIFKMDVWDYSDRFLNIMGQICPLFTILWFLLCIPVTPFCIYLNNKYFKSKSTKSKEP